MGGGRVNALLSLALHKIACILHCFQFSIKCAGSVHEAWDSLVIPIFMMQFACLEALS